MTRAEGERACVGRDDAGGPTLLACSHGTSSAAGRSAVAAMVEAVRTRRPDRPVREAFVDVQQPDVPTALGDLGRRPVRVVPLLLSAGYHVHVDLAEAVGQRARAELTGALGPDRRLVEVLARRLDEAGLVGTDRVVLAAAGSSDARAVEDCEQTAAMLGEHLGRPVSTGYISAATPPLAEAVAAARARADAGERVVVATYLLAPGYFADLAARSGADVVTAPLLAADREPPEQLVDLVLERDGA